MKPSAPVTRTRLFCRSGTSSFRSSLEDRFHGKVESWQQIRREVVLFAELPDLFDSIGSQLMDREGARFRVDDPEFFDSGARIFQFLVHQIEAAGLGRKNLND